MNFSIYWKQKDDSYGVLQRSSAHVEYLREGDEKNYHVLKNYIFQAGKMWPVFSFYI